MPLIEIETAERADFLFIPFLNREVELVKNKVQLTVSNEELKGLRLESKKQAYSVKLVRGKKAKAVNKNKGTK